MDDTKFAAPATPLEALNIARKQASLAQRVAAMHAACEGLGATIKVQYAEGGLPAAMVCCQGVVEYGFEIYYWSSSGKRVHKRVPFDSKRDVIPLDVKGLSLDIHQRDFVLAPRGVPPQATLTAEAAKKRLSYASGRTGWFAPVPMPSKRTVASQSAERAFRIRAEVLRLYLPEGFTLLPGAQPPLAYKVDHTTPNHFGEPAVCIARASEAGIRAVRTGEHPADTSLATGTPLVTIRRAQAFHHRDYGAMIVSDKRRVYGVYDDQLLWIDPGDTPAMLPGDFFKIAAYNDRKTAAVTRSMAPSSRLLPELAAWYTLGPTRKTALLYWIDDDIQKHYVPVRVVTGVITVGPLQIKVSV